MTNGARRNLTLDDVAKSWLVGSPVKFRLRSELEDAPGLVET